MVSQSWTQLNDWTTTRGLTNWSPRQSWGRLQWSKKLESEKSEALYSLCMKNRPGNGTDEKVRRKTSSVWRGLVLKRLDMKRETWRGWGPSFQPGRLGRSLWEQGQRSEVIHHPGCTRVSWQPVSQVYQGAWGSRRPMGLRYLAPVLWC